MPDNVHRRDSWLPVALAPDGCCFEVGSLDKVGVVPLTFPCIKDGDGWRNAWTQEFVLIHPTHCRPWRDLGGEGDAPGLASAFDGAAGIVPPVTLIPPSGEAVRQNKRPRRTGAS